MRSMSWQIKGFHPDTGDVARETARRSGVSATAWLNSRIINRVNQDVRPCAPDAPASPVGPLGNGAEGLS